MSQVVTRKWAVTQKIGLQEAAALIALMKQRGKSCAYEDILAKQFHDSARETIKGKWHRKLVAVEPKEILCGEVGDDFIRNLKTVSLEGTVTYRR